MPKQPNQRSPLPAKSSIFTVIFLLCFALSSVLLSSHRFNHEFSDFFDDEQEESAIEVNRSHHHEHEKSSNCPLCLVSVLQSQTISSDFITLLTSFLCLIIISLNNHNTKIHYRLSNTARSPPYTNFKK